MLRTTGQVVQRLAPALAGQAARKLLVLRHRQERDVPCVVVPIYCTARRRCLACNLAGYCLLLGVRGRQLGVRWRVGRHHLLRRWRSICGNLRHSVFCGRLNGGHAGNAKLPSSLRHASLLRGTDRPPCGHQRLDGV